MNLNKKIFSLLAAGFTLMSTLTGCVDEDLVMSPDSALMNVKEPSLVFDLNLMSMGDEENDLTDHGEDWENYIDPAKLRVLFFDMQGNYLFEADRRLITVVSRNNHWNGDNTTYRVIIPQKDLFPEERDPQLNKEVEAAFFQNGFKVAVMANWPYFVEGERRIDEQTGDEMLGAANVSTELDFQYDPNHQLKNSKLGYLSHCEPDHVYGRASTSGAALATIADPYKHLVYMGENGEYAVGRMGVYSNWVSYLYNTQRETEDFIRKGLDEDGDQIEGDVHFTYECNDPEDPEDFKYTPYSYTRTVDQLNVYSLENIWRLWNFGAGEIATLDINDGYSKESKRYWELRNKNVLLRELNKLHKAKGGDEIGAFSITDHAGNPLISSNNPKIQYRPIINEGSGVFDNTGRTQGVLAMPSQNITEDIINSLKGTITSTAQLNNAATLREQAITFKAYGEGVLRIRALSPGEGKGKVAVMVRTPSRGAQELVPTFVNDKETGEYTFYPNPDLNKGVPEHGGIPEVEFLINPNSEEYSEVFITSVGGTVSYYEIEYMRARHIFDSARNAIMPSAQNPIPMYGVQNFDPIPEDFLQDKQTFNVSDPTMNVYLPESKRYDYKYKDVYLLRSLAKIELRFDKSVFRNNPPEHVMMRVMNRTARCEPLDVVNPTEWIWYGNYSNIDTWGDGEKMPGNIEIDELAKPSSFIGVIREFNNIMAYNKDKDTRLYDDSSDYQEWDPVKDQEKYNASMKEYHRRTSWFYGQWAANDESLDDKNRQKYYWQTPWQWNVGSLMTEAPAVPTKYEFPRVFNSRVDRSDYCRFHRISDKDGYIRYVLYSPEKNILDTDSKGVLAKRPKIQHIEVRFKDMNDVMNFDDNNCYRIYFTEYNEENGKAMKSWNRDGTSNTFDDAEREKNATNTLIPTLQPVMRNCHYIFTVNSINDEQIKVRMNVCGPDIRSGHTFVIN